MAVVAGHVARVGGDGGRGGARAGLRQRRAAPQPRQLREVHTHTHTQNKQLQYHLLKTDI